MAEIPFPRCSPDRRTLVVADSRQLGDAVGVAQEAGWVVLLARTSPHGLELVLSR